MNVAWLALGVFLVGIAVYTVRDPMNRGRSWVRPSEWKRDPGGAAEKHRMRTVIWATVTSAIGLLFLLFGLAN